MFLQNLILQMASNEMEQAPISPFLFQLYLLVFLSLLLHSRCITAISIFSVFSYHKVDEDLAFRLSFLFYHSMWSYKQNIQNQIVIFFSSLTVFF